MIRQFLAHRTDPRVGYRQCVQEICLANLSLVIADPKIIPPTCRSPRIVAFPAGARDFGQHVEILRDELPLTLVIGYAPELVKQRLSLLSGKSLGTPETTERGTGLTQRTSRYRTTGERAVGFAAVTGLFSRVDFFFSKSDRLSDGVFFVPDAVDRLGVCCQRRRSFPRRRFPENRSRRIGRSVDIRRASGDR